MGSGSDRYPGTSRMMQPKETMTEGVLSQREKGLRILGN